MKTIKELEQYLEERGFTRTTYFNKPDFVDAIVGTTDEGNLIYDYDKMVESLKKSEKWDEEDAIEWIDYNTIRTIPYMGGSHPIILYSIENF